jgi:hypothetical protein
MANLITQTPQEYYDGNDHGGYQFTSLRDIIENFMIVYVGEDKVITKVKRADVQFHAMRAMQELSFDTFKSVKSKEINLPASLQMILPQDYVNYTKISWVDDAGIKHRIYPHTCTTSNPFSTPFQNTDGDFEFNATGTFTAGTNGIVLDDLYPNLAGQIFEVTSPSLIASNGPWYMFENTTTGASVSTITVIDNIEPFSAIASPPSNSFMPSTSTTEVLTFKPIDGSLIPRRESGVRVAGCTINSVTDQFSNVNTNSITCTNSVSDVKEGMAAHFSSTLHYPVGTVVTQVDEANKTIYLSNNYYNTNQAPTTANDFLFVGLESDSVTWANYKSSTPNENNHQYDDDTYWPLRGERYGLDPQFAQANGSFYIDENNGKIHFSSNLAQKTIVVDYLSDGVGTNDEMKVHKFAEEAMYKSIAYAILSTKLQSPNFIIARYKREKFAEIRKAKLRLSNIKLEEITQILRGKSKQIKH